ncbi:MAG: GNAT family N-acetyltransferase [Candidatus Eremiobacteraeota bacterium]|nr:GNAT family N-acetyltransferase [Candidatus Eremiobacteraeota bacterium]
MELNAIPFPVYARDVLPLTKGLWAGQRDFETYVAQTGEIAASGYGKKFYQTLGLYEGRRLVASCKRYERTLHLGEQLLRAIGIGAVFTPADLRGSGYASVMLAMLLDEARANGAHVAYLFSDIHPSFYAQIGFAELPSRAISLRADSLARSRITVANAQASDWTGIRRCYDSGEKERAWGFTRAPLVWNWIRLRREHGSEQPGGTPVQLVIRSGSRVIAYVLGARDIKRDALIVEEYGFASLEGRARIPALLRSAAGDLRRVVGWLPPQNARELLPRGSVRKRKDAILMMAPLSALGKKLLATATTSATLDGVWSADHI